MSEHNIIWRNHIADSDIHVSGISQEDLFANAVCSLWSIIQPIRSETDSMCHLSLKVKASCLAYLLVDTLSEIVTYTYIYYVLYDTLIWKELNDTVCHLNFLKVRLSSMQEQRSRE